MRATKVMPIISIIAIVGIFLSARLVLAALSGSQFVEVCINGSIQEIKGEIKNGADVNARIRYEMFSTSTEDVTPLMVASALRAKGGCCSSNRGANNTEVITTLIEAGANVNAKDKNGMTPLMYAVRVSTLEVITALIEAGADVNARNYESFTFYSSPLNIAIHFRTPQAGWFFNSYPEFVAALIKAGADVNARDKDWETPLMHAAYSNSNPKLITALVEAGAELNTKDKNGMTALMHAAGSKNSTEVITTLLKLGANPKIQSNAGRIAINYARDEYKKLLDKVSY